MSQPVPASAAGTDRQRPGPAEAGAAPRRAVEWLHEGTERERSGSLSDASACYDAAIIAAELSGDQHVLAEALRREAVVLHHRDDRERARTLCQRSRDVAEAIGHDVLAAEALNTLGGLELTAGRLDDARRLFAQALERGRESRALKARVEQNLGIVANIQGELYEALTRYERSLAAYRAAGDEHGCALAYHNLGKVSFDRGQLDAAEGYYREARAIADRTRDLVLKGLCLANQAEVHLARQRYEAAREHAEAALGLFDELGASGAKVDAYRVIGMVYRETGRFALAESRLQSAIDMAVRAGSVLGEAEGSRELALLYQLMGRNQDALRLLNTAYRLFRRLDARTELIHVGGKVAALEGTYLTVVSNWGRSLETSDSHTFGHCERVAELAVAVARVLGLGEPAETTILLGAYLHDLGMVCLPHELLRKPGPLTREERELVERHPLWGIELLASVEFPWDIKPILRWHHERYSGDGYPDRLRGDEIPLGAQIVGICEVFDALTHTRAYMPAAAPHAALGEMRERRAGWSDRVFDAFLTAAALPRESPDS
jgi:HD-GYP domain-containing protein (c-di-GMP phosphodiesterase class II)